MGRGISSTFEPTADLRGKLKVPAGVCDLQPPHRRYLEDRHFDPDKISMLWDVKGIGVASRLAWRLYIPIFDKQGRQISWTTRSLVPNAEHRYLSASPEEELVDHKTVLYGAHLCRSVVVVVEGPTDAWAVGPGGAATMGLGCTPQQLMAIAEYPVRIVCFDNEPDAQRRADAVCLELAALPGQTESVRLESGKDAATADPAELAELRSAYLE
jgi:DNA primase